MAPDIDDTDVPSFLYALPLALAAFSLARRVHGEQRRESDAAQFIVHPLEVASLLHNTGHSERLVAAGILHDSLEDSATTIHTIRARFGSELAAIVAAMTEDAAIGDFERRKASLRRQIAAFGPDASAVYAADKVAKVRELRTRAGNPPRPTPTTRPDDSRPTLTSSRPDKANATVRTSTPASRCRGSRRRIPDRRTESLP
jgi:hypothetical protein